MARIIKKFLANQFKSSTKTKSRKTWLNEFVEDYLDYYDPNDLIQ